MALPEMHRMTRHVPVEDAVARAAARRRLVLAVSGGRDSMALLHAAARVARRETAMVATFDHGTGPAARRAADLVAAEAQRLALPVVIGHAAATATTSEAAWRDARLAFLREVAARCGGVIATAHTRDDQLETVLMRVLRRAGARGLAGLYAPGEFLRPLVEHSRAEVAAYAERVGARWAEDPTNTSMRYFRNRVRRDLLPALTRAAPALEGDLLALARGAAGWRRQVDEIAAALSDVDAGGASVSVAARDLARYSRAELSVLWPAIAARVGLAMDWRGTERAAEFTRGNRGGGGARIQLSGGWQILRSRGRFVLAQWRQDRSLSPGADPSRDDVFADQ